VPTGDYGRWWLEESGLSRDEVLALAVEPAEWPGCRHRTKRTTFGLSVFRSR
jgi:hypothetical protein